MIAYKQPVTAPEIMEIRGVQGAGVLKTLLDRKLIADAGRKNVIGKPILYKTTKEFLIQFGLKDLSELPSLKEFEEIRRMAFADDGGTAAASPSPKQVRRSEAAEPTPLAPRSGSRSDRPEDARSANAGARRARTGSLPEAGGLMAEERLQKILSQAGVASRRQAEQIIQEGRVTVNGAAVTELGIQSRPGARPHQSGWPPDPRRPSTRSTSPSTSPTTPSPRCSDPQHRATVMDLLRGVKERVYPVGRLDYHSEGLLLLTNDGELANAIMSAATHLAKTYLVKANGALTPDQEQQFREGVPLSGRRTAAGRPEADPQRRRIPGTKCACSKAATTRSA